MTCRPPDYPDAFLQYLSLNDPTLNIAPYHERGWCFTEMCMSNLVKSSSLVLDLGYLPETVAGLGEIVDACTKGTGRLPPLTPGDFKEILYTKRFTSIKADSKLVNEMYMRAFMQRLGGKEVLDYQSLGWGDAEVIHLAKALVYAAKVNEIFLQRNPAIDDAGVYAIAEVLQDARVAPNLRHVWLGIDTASAKAKKALEDVLVERRQRNKLHGLVALSPRLPPE